MIVIPINRLIAKIIKIVTMIKINSLALLLLPDKITKSTKKLL